MLTELNERLAQSAQAMARLEKLERTLSALTAEQRELEAALAKLRRQARAEERDVERLEGLSLTALFYNMLGSKDEQLRKERQEALAAQLKCDEAAKRLDGLAQELTSVRAEMGPLAGARETHSALLKEKEAAIAAGPEAGAAELFRLTEQEQSLRSQLQQLDEARAAGRRAEGSLTDVGRALESAQGWGTWDMLGGGLLATAAKHSRIDDARSHASRAQSDLSAFARELKDVAMVIQIGDVGVDGFTRFADYFFDGLIADWVVQSRINQSLTAVRQSQAQVHSLLDQVERRRVTAAAELAQTRSERAAFIERS